jgi:hypothetical protein
MKFLWIILAIAWIIAFSIAEDFPYSVKTVDDEGQVNKNIVESSQSTINQVAQDYIWNDVVSDNDPAILYISKVINYFLWILWFIAFLVLIYWFSLVYTGGDSSASFQKWTKYVKGAIIAIIVIWISWLISSWFISIYSSHVATKVS